MSEEVKENEDPIHGQLPDGPVIFAACDDKYFQEHAPALIASCDNVKKNLHLHIVNPSKESAKLADEMSPKIKTSKVTITYHFSDFSNIDESSTKAYYAAARFFLAPVIIEAAKEVMIVDVDCLIMNDFDFPSKPVGYFPREPLPGTIGWENEGTKVAAGAVYFNDEGLKYAKEVAQTLAELPLQWFSDQIALSRVLGGLPKDMVEYFDEQFMDWEFKEGTTIWTGKGPRKYDNETYVSKKKEFAECLTS